MRGCFPTVRDLAANAGGQRRRERGRDCAATLVHRPPLAVVAALIRPLAMMAALAACAPATPPDARASPFTPVPYAPISRVSVIAVALRERRPFCAPVDDDLPGSRPPTAPAEKPERAEGAWQRAGEY